MHTARSSEEEKYLNYKIQENEWKTNKAINKETFWLHVGFGLSNRMSVKDIFKQENLRLVIFYKLISIQFFVSRF